MLPLKLLDVMNVLHSYYTILPHCSMHPESPTYTRTSADKLAIHVALCQEKQEVCETCALTVE